MSDNNWAFEAICLLSGPMVVLYLLWALVTR